MKLLADECIPRKAFEKLRELRNPGNTTVTEMVHLLERFEAGSPDDQWVREIGDGAEQFIVITGDRASKSGRGDPRLPTLLPQAGVSGVFLSGKLQQKPAFEKVRGLMYVWPALEDMAKQPGGTRKKLVPYGDGYRLTAWPL